MLAFFGIIAIVAFAAVIFAESRPDTIEIQRNIVIDAPPEIVFALIDDFHNWPRWQPLDRDDPSIQRSFGGEKSGLGARSEWRGKSTAGRQEVIESEQPTMIMVKVDFTKPFEAHNINTFTLAPARTGTSLTWTMRGTLSFAPRLMGIVIDMDKMMGKHFEDGLLNLKAAAEGGQSQQSPSGSSLRASSDGRRITDK